MDVISSTDYAELVEALRFTGRYASETEREAATRRIAERKSAANAIAELVKERGELNAKVYQPGVFRCAKCGFRLVQSNLNANSGTVTARDNPGEKCPNDGSPMWRVSWQEDASEAVDWGTKQFDRALVTEAENKRLREELASDRGSVPLDTVRGR